jgi:rod shape-determining protein MreD
MSVLLAILGATAAALAELSLVPYLGIEEAHPHPVLVLAVIWTLASGLDRGLPVAFAGGLVLDMLAGRPLGMTALALLAVVGLAAVLGRWLYRVRPVAPVLAVPVLSLGYSLLLFGIHSAVRSPLAVADPVATVLPGAVYDGLLGLVLGPLAISLHDRRAAETRVDW